MYTPIGDRLIVHNPEEKKTDSGIILQKEKGWVLKVEVINTTPENARFKGKTILVERGKFEDFGDEYGSVKIENVMAIKDGGRTETTAEKQS